MTTHADRWLASLADSLTWLARHSGAISVLVRSDSTPSSTRLRLSAEQALFVAQLVEGAVSIGEREALSVVDVVDFIRTEAPAESSGATDPALLVARLRARFGEDALPDGLEHHLADLSDDVLSSVAARVETTRSVKDLLGSHYPASEPLPPSLGSLKQAPRDGTEVWLLVESRIEVPVDEFVVARWQSSTHRWICEDPAGQWQRRDSDASGWLPIDAPCHDPALRKAIRRRWHGSDDELRQRLGDDEAAS